MPQEEQSQPVTHDVPNPFDYELPADSHPSPGKLVGSSLVKSLSSVDKALLFNQEILHRQNVKILELLDNVKKNIENIRASIPLGVSNELIASQVLVPLNQQVGDVHQAKKPRLEVSQLGSFLLPGQPAVQEEQSSAFPIVKQAFWPSPVKKPSPDISNERSVIQTSARSKLSPWKAHPRQEGSWRLRSSSQAIKAPRLIPAHDSQQLRLLDDSSNASKETKSGKFDRQLNEINEITKPKSPPAANHYVPSTYIRIPVPLRNNVTTAPANNQSRHAPTPYQLSDVGIEETSAWIRRKVPALFGSTPSSSKNDTSASSMIARPADSQDLVHPVSMALVCTKQSSLVYTKFPKPGTPGHPRRSSVDFSFERTPISDTETMPTLVQVENNHKRKRSMVDLDSDDGEGGPDEVLMELPDVEVSRWEKIGKQAWQKETKGAGPHILRMLRDKLSGKLRLSVANRNSSVVIPLSGKLSMVHERDSSRGGSTNLLLTRPIEEGFNESSYYVTQSVRVQTQQGGKHLWDSLKKYAPHISGHQYFEFDAGAS